MNDTEEKLSKEETDKLQAGREYVTSRKQQQSHFQDLRMLLKRLSTDPSINVAKAIEEHLESK